METSAHLGELLKELRASRRMSQQAAADAAGVARNTLNRWERGAFQPRLPELNAVLTALDASAGQRRRALERIGAPRAAAQLREQDVRAASKVGIEDGETPVAGTLLRAMRLRSGRTAEEVAGALGVSLQSVRTWERSDAWPTADRLHQLFRLFDAAPGEIAALRAGNAWLATLTPLPEADSPNALDRMQTYLNDLFFPQDGFDAEEDTIKDIAYLALLARLVPLAIRYPPAQTTLLNTYAGYATWLSGHRRFPEAGRYAERALELKQGKGKQNPEWLRAAIVRSHATVYGGRHTSKAAAVRVATSLLEGILPIAATSGEPVFEAWMLSEMAEFAYLNDQPELALSRAARAANVAARVNETEYSLRRFDHARLLVRLNRAGEGLTVMPPEIASYHPPQRSAERLLRTEALLQLGKLSEAHDWLGKAYEIVQEYKLNPHEANALAARF